MSNFGNWKSIIDQAFVFGSAFAETTAVSCAKSLGVTGIRTGSKMLPIIGNIVAALDEAYMMHKIHNLQETAASLTNSQSLLQGQLSEVQFGLNEGKAKQQVFLNDLKEIKSSLQKESLKVEEIKELKLQQQALESLTEQNKANLEKLRNSQDFLFDSLKSFEKAFELIKDKNELNSSEISELQKISHSEKARLDSLLNSFTQCEKKITSLQNKVEQLYNQHLELEQRINQVEDRTKQIDAELEQLRNELLALKTKKQKDAEKLNKLIRYQQLKLEKQTLENELKKYLEIPVELPQSVESTKFLDIGKFSDLTLADWLTFQPYPLDPSIYNYYFAKFGQEAMQGWTFCNNGKGNNSLVDKTIKYLENNFFSNSFPNEQILQKQMLVANLRNNVDLLNEIAEELGFDAEVTSEETFINDNLIGASQSVYFSLMIFFFFLFFLYLTFKAGNKKARELKEKVRNNQSSRYSYNVNKKKSESASFLFIFPLFLVTATLLFISLLPPLEKEHILTAKNEAKEKTQEITNPAHNHTYPKDLEKEYYRIITDIQNNKVESSIIRSDAERTITFYQHTAYRCALRDCLYWTADLATKYCSECAELGKG